MGYSVKHPSNWIVNNINKNEVGFKPKGDKYAQVQVAAYRESLGLSSIASNAIRPSVEASLRQFYEAVSRQGTSDCNGLDVYYNQRGTPPWDWTAMYTVFCDDVPLVGVQHWREGGSKFYIVTVMYAGESFDEGLNVVKSFTVR